MRFGIPLLGSRVAPRCTFADSVLLVTIRHRRIQARKSVPLSGTTWADLAAVLGEHEVGTLVCGGIGPATRESIRARDVAVIDNVAGTFQEVTEALRLGRIHPGFGLEEGALEERSNGSRGIDGEEDAGGPEDCLACRDRVCLQGHPCPYLEVPPAIQGDEETENILESAWDVALEEERTLCRLAELVYFAMEAGYERLGVAFCEDLREPATILTGVLRRFFEVVPVGCRFGGDVPAGACDAGRLARYLNEKETELNVVVGLCVGTDCVFNRESKAPVTTIFVKDKSLANNPIGAVYSHYYLEEI